MSNTTTFHECCGRNIQLAHAPTCLASAQTQPQPATEVTAVEELTIKRVGARIQYTRGGKTGTLRFRIVSVAKKAECEIKANPAKLDECIAMQQAGVWS